jgi:hypothetical protein
MMLTNEQQKALTAVRTAICDRLKSYDFTDDMLNDKSVLQLVSLLFLCVGHRNYLGQFTHTCITLEEIFGTDGFWHKPLEEPEAEHRTDTESPQQEQKKETVH